MNSEELAHFGYNDVQVYSIVASTMLDLLTLKKHPELLACIDLFSISKYKRDFINVCF